MALDTQRATSTALSSLQVDDTLGTDALGDDHLADPLEKPNPPPPRPTTLELSHDLGTHMRYAAGEPLLEEVLDHLRTFEDYDTEAGVALTDLDKMALTLQVLTRGGMSFEDQETVLTQMFFDHGDGHDAIRNIRRGSGGWVIDFYEIDAPGIRVVPLTVPNPPVFQGKDTNARAKKVQAAKIGFRGTNWRGVSTSRDSVWAIQRDAIRQSFLDGKGAPWADLSRAEQDASDAFRQAFDDWLQDRMVEYVEKIGNRGLEIVRAYRDELASRGRPVNGRLIGQRALQFVLNYRNPEWWAMPHSDLRVEDEAVAEWICEQLGYQIKFNADDLTDVQVLSAPAPPEVSGPAPAPTEEAPGPTSCADALRAEVQRSEQAKRLDISEDSTFYQALPADAQAIVEGLWAAPSVQHKVVVDHRDAYQAMLTAWIELEEARADGRPADDLERAFDAARKAFVEASTDKRGGVTLK